MMPLDELDHKIIELLQRDGRSSNIELAKLAGVSEGTIRRRFRSLVDDGVIHVTALLDPNKIGKPTTALVGLEVDPSRVDPVSNELSALPDVQFAAITTGAFDIFIWVALRSAQELSLFLRNNVGSIEGVRRTETFVNLSIKKNQSGPRTLGSS